MQAPIPPTPRWLIEGVCGTGKSSLLAALHQRFEAGNQSLVVFSEEQTFGDLMDELASSKQLCWRLEQCLELLQQLSADQACILERFHPSYFAQIPQPEMYVRYDRVLTELGFQMVLLDVPDQALRARSLYRYERQTEGWIAGNLAFYGSEEKAIRAFQLSQQRRRDYLKYTQMPVRVLDTQSQNWPVLAAELWPINP
jgi:hypothetical protein